MSVLSQRFVYLINGPGGCYVGQTTDPARRERAHWAQSSNGPSKSDHRIHRVMRRDGVERYRFTVIEELVGTADDARRAETSAILALRAFGAPVLNRNPSAQHMGHAGHMRWLSALDAELDASERAASAVQAVQHG